MSFRSYTSYDCTVPDTTELHGDFESHNVWGFAYCKHVGDIYDIHFDGETGWSTTILDDLKDLFRMPLDEVPGLELHCHYETDEDGHFEFDLDIEDGKCTYKEAVIQMVEQPMSECPVSIDFKED